MFGSGNFRAGKGFDIYVDQFASVTIMGACLKDSLMYALWQKDGVRFEPHHGITQELRYQEHDCGERLQIRYLFDKPWSKHFRDSIHTLGDETLTSLDILLAAITEEFEGQPFVYLVNKDKEDEVCPKLAVHDGTQLPNSPYGLNKYDHFNQAVVLSALNTSPAHIKFLKEACDVDPEAGREAMYHQACYQAIMRTSLRKAGATDPVKIIVSDLNAARSLQELFPGAVVSDIITNAIEQPRRPRGRPLAATKKSNNEIKRDQRATARLIHRVEMEIANGNEPDPVDLALIPLLTRSDNKARGTLKTLIVSNYSVPRFPQKTRKLAIPLFKDIYASRPSDELDVSIDDCENFISQLKSCSDGKLDAKHANILISTTEFDPSLSEETDRGLDNIKRIWGIWLDLDGGALKPEELAKIFPTTRMVLFNSWSDGNYRVFIPTTCFMSADAYKEIVKSIIYKVEQTASDEEMQLADCENRNRRNFVSAKTAAKQQEQGNKPNPVHGIDLSKVTPTSMFYLPSACGDNPAWSFFTDYDQPERKVLDPDVWLDHPVHSLHIEAAPDVVQLVPTNPTANVCGANDNSARDQSSKMH